jgi:hypothetical protein
MTIRLRSLEVKKSLIYRPASTIAQLWGKSGRPPSLQRSSLPLLRAGYLFLELVFCLCPPPLLFLSGYAKQGEGCLAREVGVETVPAK